MEAKRNSISGGNLPLREPSTEVYNALDEIQAERKKRSFPYRGYHPKRESSSNKRNWMELYPDPKRQTGQRPTEAQGTLWHDGELF